MFSSVESGWLWDKITNLCKKQYYYANDDGSITTLRGLCNEMTYFLKVLKIKSVLSVCERATKIKYWRFRIPRKTVIWLKCFQRNLKQHFWLRNVDCFVFVRPQLFFCSWYVKNSLSLYIPVGNPVFNTPPRVCIVEWAKAYMLWKAKKIMCCKCGINHYRTM